jgi:Xaa-Pro aminopeptidase
VYEWPSIDWADLRRQRRDRVGQLMKAADLDVLLLTGHDNIRYAIDYRSMLIVEGFDWYAALVDRAGEATVFVPYVAEDVAKPQPDLPWVTKFVATPSWVPSMSQAAIWMQLLAREVRASGARRVGVELLTFQFVDALRRELPNVQFESIAEPLYEVRQVKEPDEIRLLEAASTVNALATSQAMASVREGMTDFDVLAVVMERLQHYGVEYLTHSLCVTRDAQLSGNWFAKGRRLWDGDACFFDVGCYGVGGYASDMCRTAFVGEPPRSVRTAYAGLLEAYRAGQEAARPGIRVSAIDQTINDALRKQGLPQTPYSMGHGVGLRACELPIIYRPRMMVKDEPLREGMVISLEPETTVQVDGHPVVLKLEDNFLVERAGLRRLTLSGYASV